MKRRTIVRAVAIIIGAPLVALLFLALYLRFADLSGWRDAVAAKLSEGLGREVRIAGEFRPEIGLTSRITAGEITIANPDRWSDAPMATVGHLVLELDLWSLVSGPLTIHDVEIKGARVLLEKDTDGRTNWDFGAGTDSAPSRGPLELVLRHVLVKGLQLTWSESSRSTPLKAEITRFESTEDHAGMLDIVLDVSVEDHDLQVSGRLGTLEGLLNGTALEHDLKGELNNIHFSSTGKIAELTTLGGLDETANVQGNNLADLRGLVDLPSELTGPFSLSATLSPTATGSDVKLDAAAAGITAKVAGTIDSLLGPKVLDVTVAASGPSIRTVGSLTGVADLPDDPFSVSGGVRWEGFPITFRQVEITVGENSLTADGVLGPPPAMMGTDFSIHGGGPDISSIGALVGIDLPRDRFSVTGHVVRVDGGLEVEHVDARIGRTVVTANGTVGDPPDYIGTTLSVHAEGPNFAHFNRLIGMDLPAVDFAIDGRLAQGNDAITLDDVNARLGSATVRVDGSLHTGKGLSGTTLRMEAQGSDATQIMLIASFTDLQAEPWTAAGRLTFVDSGYRLDGVSANFGSLHVTGDGLIAAAKRVVGTDLRLDIEDSDLSHAMSIFGVKGFPRQPVRAGGGFKVDADGYGLDGVTATAGDIDVAVDGLIGRGSDLDGTRGQVTVHGPRLESLGPYFHQTGLPQTPFSVAGNVQVTGGLIDLDTVVAEIASNRVTVDGTLTPKKGLVGTDVTIDISGPDLGRAGRLAAGLSKLPELPAGNFSLATRLRIDDAGYEIDGLHASLDRAVATVDGRIGSAEKWIGTDLTVDADGPNSSLFSALAGVMIPEASFKVSGRVQRTDTAFLFDRVAVELGGHSMTLHGSLGERPRLVGTELDLSASGPGTALIAELTGFTELPDEPFNVAGHFEGTPEKFTADGLEITLGDTHVTGTLEVDIRGKPDITARIVSDHFEGEVLKSLFSGPGDGGPDAHASSNPPKAGRLFSDKPINLAWLQRADADVDITIGTLQMPVERFHDVQLNARLADGRLDVHHLAMAGSRGGSGLGSLVLEPADNGYLANLVLTIDAVRFDLPGEDKPNAATEPPLDFDVHLQLQGTSPHSLVSSANGSIQIVVGKGVMDNRVLDLISQDILLTLLTAFNPFAKHQTATELQCAIALLTFKNGLMTLEPMAMQSDKMTMLGEGQIDFKTEKLNLNWVTKPRKGIGLSASMITNPYIKLGGTLAKPAIELKGAQAVASTGVAVATLGISLVAKGMLDRATAEKKVCKQALEEISSRTNGPSKSPNKTK